jgi:transcriptional regulator with XRE-family HTH domain
MLPRGARPMRSRGRGGARLAAARRAADVSQHDIAKALEIPQPLLSFIEGEHIRLPPGFSRQYLAALDVIIARL